MENLKTVTETLFLFKWKLAATILQNHFKSMKMIMSLKSSLYSEQHSEYSILQGSWLTVLCQTCKFNLN